MTALCFKSILTSLYLQLEVLRVALQRPSNHDRPPGIFRFFPCSSFPPTAHLGFSPMARTVPLTAVWAHSSVPVIMWLPLPGMSSSHSLPLQFFLFLKIQLMSLLFRTSLDFRTVLSLSFDGALSSMPLSRCVGLILSF